MSNVRTLRILILLINTIGLLGFLAWLMLGQQRILYTQEGVVFFLPCIPFFFVYFMVLRSPRPEEDLDGE